MTLYMNNAFHDDNLKQILRLCYEKMRYGDLWREFEFEELEAYTRIKKKRSEILRKKGMFDKFEDDLLDAVNMQICILLKRRFERSESEAKSKKETTNI